MGVEIGGVPVVELRCEGAADEGAPAFASALIAPGRGMMLLQATVRRPGADDLEVIHSPPLAEMARRLNAGPDDPFGNAAFGFGGAILAPFANRIRGRLVADSPLIETWILGHPVRLPANWKGGGPDAEPCAMHGLILARVADELKVIQSEALAQATAVIRAGDFGGHWPSSTDLSICWTLTPQALSLEVTAVNAGVGVLPMGIGWHPYFRLPSGQRGQARLTVPARRRLVVADYDDVMPTGEIAQLAGSGHDFSPQLGRTLGDLSLDDCFVDLQADGKNEMVSQIVDPAADYGMRIVAASPQIKAFQVYAPAREPFVAIEPQFNWTNPFGAEWIGADTGMALLQPGEQARYGVRLEPFTPGTAAP